MGYIIASGSSCTMWAVAQSGSQFLLLMQVLPNAAISYAAYSYFKELIAGKAV